MYGWRVVKVVSTLTTRISRLKAIDQASDGAFESCALAEYSNNISGHLYRFVAVWRHVEDDHIKVTMGIKGDSAPASSDALVLD